MVEPVVGFLFTVAVLLLPISASEVGAAFVAALMGILGQPIFLPVQYESVYTPAFWEASIEAGWMPSFERQYYGELARYQRTYGGPTGRLPGDARWAVSFMVVYLGTVGIAIGTVLLLFPVVGAWSVVAFIPVEIAVAAVCFKLYLGRDRARLRLAAERGFRLRELGKTIAKTRSAQLSAGGRAK